MCFFTFPFLIWLWAKRSYMNWNIFLLLKKVLRRKDIKKKDRSLSASSPSPDNEQAWRFALVRSWNWYGQFLFGKIESPVLDQQASADGILQLHILDRAAAYS